MLHAQEEDESTENQASQEPETAKAVEDDLDKDDQVEELVEWTVGYDRMFVDRTPILDDDAPDVGAFDEQGNPFELSDTFGKYTVLVFGCLT